MNYKTCSFNFETELEETNKKGEKIKKKYMCIAFTPPKANDLKKWAYVNNQNQFVDPPVGAKPPFKDEE